MNNLIKEKRTVLGLTQDELAEKLEVSRQTIISLERGRYNPSLVLAFKIAEIIRLPNRRYIHTEKGIVYLVKKLYNVKLQGTRFV